MARIAGVDIPRDRRVVASLPVIYGIGPTTAQRILDRANISPDKRVRVVKEGTEATPGFFHGGILARTAPFRGRFHCAILSKRRIGRETA